jgi:prepilin-type N-terminal cleavage/methylation domain-containing protein
VLSRSRRGFTLLELVVSVGLMLVVGGAVYRLLLTTQRLTRAQAAQVMAQSSLRAGTLLVINELRELSPVDLMGMGGGFLTFRAGRGLGLLCQAPTATQLRIGRTGFSGQRDPQAGRDSVSVFLEGAPDTEADDSWLSLPIAQVSSSAPCIGDVGSSISLTVPSTAALADVPAGSPIRISEVMELKLYRSQGKSWLGARSVSAGEAIQPIVGPLRNDDGLLLEYLDGGENPTGVASAVRSIRITLRSVAESLPPAFGGQGPSLEGELTTQVALRNIPRE